MKPMMHADGTIRILDRSGRCIEGVGSEAAWVAAAEKISAARCIRESKRSILPESDGSSRPVRGAIVMNQAGWLPDQGFYEDCQVL
jgi:hypothetical protein